VYSEVNVFSASLSNYKPSALGLVCYNGFFYNPDLIFLNFGEGQGMRAAGLNLNTTL